MPRRPDPRAVAIENRAFLRRLALTGNAREAARSLGLSRTRFTKRRGADAAFAQAWDAALALADGKAAGAAGAGVSITRLRSGRLQCRAARASALTRAAEQRFLLALSATANVRLAARAAGFSHASFYLRRRASPGFAREWRLALEEGYGRLELACLAAADPESHEHDAWRHNERPELPPLTANQMLQLMHLHQKEARLLAEPPHLKRRRGESAEARDFRLSAMGKERARRARESFRVAEAARAAKGEETWFEWEPPIVLPDLAQVDWSKADPGKTPHDPDTALFGGWRISNLSPEERARAAEARDWANRSGVKRGRGRG